MTSPFDGLPTSWRKKKLSSLKEKIAQGASLETLSQDERDLLHMETSQENVEYWRNENAIAASDERCIFCQSVMRSIIIALRAMEPQEDDTLDRILTGILTEAARLPATH